MQPFLKIVGNGRKTARDFTTEEAEEAFTMVMNGKASLAQVVVLMAAMRIKEESVDELTVFTRILRPYCERLTQSQPHLVDICIPYDGRGKIPLLIPAAALIAAVAGAKIGLHGRLGQVLPPKFGVGIGDVLKSLGVAVNASLSDAEKILNEVGVSFVVSEKFAPCLTKFDQIRLDFGMRSFFNTIEKLVNPFNAETAMVGVFHQPVMRRVAQAAQAQGYARGLVVQGPEGSVEALTSRRNPVVEFQGDTPFKEWMIDPAAFDWWARIEDSRSVTPQMNADLTVELLNPTEASPYQRSTLLSAALILYASGKSATFEDGLQTARKSLESGAALERLKLWREVSQNWMGSP
jgi:anthranilate phosphoribosyltransferase